MDLKVHIKISASVLAVTVVAVLCAAAYLRNNVWRDEVTLWRDTVLKSPNRARANYELGRVYGDAGQTGYAEYYMRKSIMLDGGVYFNYYLKQSGTANRFRRID